ncbi:3-dehydroquinate synthase-like protein isoform X1 isoform A [Chlorella sorokiniana]|uniref:3-dehydroquinate synthase-like protein isoform X1 isoform A n=1 Tax=Chlorella sorokiniana TaxID=3076 RepID=A0A2P6TI81_CHLSO|nr:3-dehydroquinate synthase-like protein isoform X1 isoform A [Chlorella sorokiniana]|eukprot:PRW34003.1 3-dehydroquinate synthase-like protein isoform X1 isoform A [Chlorella sorokiniana]
MPTPKTIDDIYDDYKMRRSGLLLALIDDAREFYDACDPKRENLCLYGHPDGNWSVDLPVEEVPPELPEPVLGINFARDGMDRKDWLALCAVHSDAWLYSLAFFYAARFDADGRAELFSLLNQHPTVYEVVTGRVARNKMYKRKVPKQQTAAAQAAIANQAAALAAYEAPDSFVRPGYQAADQPLPTGRLLTVEDVTPALQGRQAELFWPDDGKWYLIQFMSIHLDSRKADVQYATGEVELLDLDEPGHLRRMHSCGRLGAAPALRTARISSSPHRLALARVVAAAAQAGGGGGTAARPKLLWLSTSSQDALTAGLEAGVNTVVFNESQTALAQEWQQLGRFEALTRTADGRLLGADGKQVGRVRLLASPEDLRAAEREAAVVQGVVVMDASDWQIIPAENLVAAYQANPGATLLAAAPDCAAGRVMLEALEAGTDGVLLQTDSPAEVRALAQYVHQRQQAGGAKQRYEAARVTAVRPVGMGDRACVDLCSLLAMGEGMLVGSFARALFLVHSECAESRYIASRPFRVNAGPVHAYLQLPGGRTGYLSELRSGAEVMVADAQGATRTALVGRVKIESRPLVLVEAELPDGEPCSVLLQNAETVRLVGPAPGTSSSASSSSSRGGKDGQAAGGARHTGVAIDESITER